MFGCAKPKPHYNTPPEWLNNPDKLTSFEAVGSAKPNFQGMHIQRMEAILKARTILAQKITSYITYRYYQNLKTSSNRFKKYDYSVVTNISKLLLQNSYQKDAYIDKDSTLYVLVEVKNSPKLASILKENIQTGIKPQKLKTYKYSADELLKRRCYDKKTLLNIKTKYPLFMGKPIWFYRPNMEGSGEIGIAEQYENSSFESQKEVALTIAKAQLAKRKKLQIDSLYRLSSIFLHNEMGEEDMEKIQTRSRANIKNILLKDIWIDPKQCEVYVWIEEENL
jgi:hypothetical protein